MKKIMVILAVIIGIIAIMLLGLFYQLGSIEVRQTKDYAEMYVDEVDVVDYSSIITPPEKYSQLLQIDLKVREELANYMKTNNYKLKSGRQEFIRNNPTIDELINDGFLFEKMEE